MEGEEVGAFELVRRRWRGVEEPAEFVEVPGPLHAVEEFDGFELEFVAGLRGDAGAEVKMGKTFAGGPFDGAGHEDHAEVPAAVGEVVERVVVVHDAWGLDVEQDGSEFAFGSVRIGFGEVEQVADDGAGEDTVEPFRVHDAGPEAVVGVGHPTGAAFGCVCELGLGDEFHPDGGAFPEDAAVLGGGPPFGEWDAEIPDEVEPVHLRVTRKETGVEGVGGCLARFEETPDDVGVEISRVVGCGLGEEEFHGR